MLLLASWSRRRWLSVAGASCALAAFGTQAAGVSPTTVEVWKDPQCGCCQDWIEHMQAHGFSVQVHSSGNAAVRARLVYQGRKDPYDVLLVSHNTGSLMQPQVRTRVFTSYR